MNYEERNEQSGPYRHFRNSLDLGMGLFYIIIGVVIISVKYFGFIELSVVYAYILGGLMVLYGAFRIYRGLQNLRALHNKRRT
jgi:hypothetical protein